MKINQFNISFTDPVIKTKVNLAYGGLIKDSVEALNLYIKSSKHRTKEITHLANSYNPNKPTIWVMLSLTKEGKFISKYGIVENNEFNTIYKYEERV